MAFVTVFKRYELKYILTLEQKQKILEAMSPYMQLDRYGQQYETSTLIPTVTDSSGIQLKSLTIKKNCEYKAP